jgi:hypothetical protein
MRPEKRLPVAEELGETATMFLVYPTLSENDMLAMIWSEPSKRSWRGLPGENHHLQQAPDEGVKHR